uniref:Uncharacterized protein n=1 Tax=Catharus ustulatus TaxID=91951 RepID=A0A8C3TY77_CATUS
MAAGQDGCPRLPCGKPDMVAPEPGVPPLLAGTRIICDRKFLTPPCCLPQTPGVTSLAQSSLVKLEELKERNESQEPSLMLGMDV